MQNRILISVSRARFSQNLVFPHRCSIQQQSNASYHEKGIDHRENSRNVGSLDKNHPSVGTGIVGASVCAPIGAEPNVDNPHDLWEKVYSKQRVCRRTNTLPLDEPIHSDKIRFVCISDTHNKLGEILSWIPRGDVLLHCGDFTNFGDADELDQFNSEIGSLPHRHKIVIAGNHELGFEDGEDVEGRRADALMWAMGSGRRGTPRGYERLTNCTYLQDSSTKVFGLTIYGTSWHPLPGFSFFRPRGVPIHKEWMKIPTAQPRPMVDVLMTHTPPLGHSDVVENGQRKGDADLLNCVEMRVKPKVHVFGHVHEQPFATTNGETLFVNAAICADGNITDDGQKWHHSPKNPPVLFDLQIPEGFSKSTNY